MKLEKSRMVLNACDEGTGVPNQELKVKVADMANIAKDTSIY
ncbi:MAG: hypothetical protein ACTSUE_17730 [Promethearchaeota archaeon]